MRRSELYARYFYYKEELIEVSREEFFSHFTQENKDNITHFVDGSTECYSIRLDGVDYLKFSSCWHVGWNGDVDSDEFYCKKESLTIADMVDISKLFS